MNTFPTIFQAVVYTRTYARWSYEVERRERWNESVTRYTDFLLSDIISSRHLLPDDRNYVMQQLGEAKLQMLGIGVVGSMRALWSAGKALREENACAYNCFSPDTSFVTSSGIRKFSDFNDDDKVMALSNGSFKEAIVKKFGQESTLQLVVGKGKSVKTLNPTAGHRWIVQEKHGSGITNVIKTTDQLKVGDVLKRSPKRGKEIVPCPIGIMHGIVFGDGSSQNNRSHIVLCDSKTDLLPYFTTGIKSGTSERTRISGLPLEWKDLPKSFQDPSYLLGFLIGWFSVDGSLGQSGNNIALTNKSKENLEWFRDAAAVLGIFCKDITGGDRSNPFDQSKTSSLFKIEVHGDSLPSNFFIREYAKYRFAQRKVELEWKVKSITTTNDVSDVWCLQVPETESFALDCGIETKNCAYTTIQISSLKDFAEVLYLLMCGCGVSYSCERQFIAKLPQIPYLTSDDRVVVFEDSKWGWADGYYKFLTHLSKGYIPKYDLSKLRPAGTILKTFGGRSSGPEPLRELLDYTIRLFKTISGEKFTSEDVSDLVCKIADIVVVGGARRSATLSLSNPSDRRMAEYKKGEYWHEHRHRGMVNVSSCYTDVPNVLPFLEDFTHLIESRSGERGFVNRLALQAQLEKLGRPVTDSVGVNPCAEIILQSKQFCNLSEVIVRSGDSLDTLKKKVRAAVLFGFLQSLLTNFNFISSRWRANCEDDRILGVSLTGLRDHEVIGKLTNDAAGWLNEMKDEAHRYESKLADMFGIEPAKAITCVKPSGTVSQLVDSASGLHVRFSEYYVRRIRMTVNDPLAKLLISQGMKWNPENGETRETCRTQVFAFPVKSPVGSITKKDVTAIDQLNYWKMLKTHWCDHNPSCTVYVKDKEWISVAAWVYENFPILGGVSFLPEDNNYDQAPYEQLTEEEYDSWVASMPDIDLSKLSEFEKEDYTTGSHEFACTGNSCEIQ